MMPGEEVYLAPEITAAVSLTLSCAHSMINIGVLKSSHSYTHTFVLCSKQPMFAYKVWYIAPTKAFEPDLNVPITAPSSHLN